jgi:hypothetical protein
MQFEARARPGGKGPLAGAAVAFKFRSDAEHGRDRGKASGAGAVRDLG